LQHKITAVRWQFPRSSGCNDDLALLALVALVVRQGGLRLWLRTLPARGVYDARDAQEQEAHTEPV
jgi:hypothetical protein